MNIPHVKQLREESLINYKKQLNTVLEKRKNDRLLWKNERQKKYNEDLTKLKKAHDNMVISIKKDIIEKTKSFILHSNKFTIINPHYKETDLNKFQADTVYKGFWNPKKKNFGRLMHYEAGINKTPFEEIKDDMEQYGYIIKDNSDISKSTNVFLEIEFNY